MHNPPIMRSAEAANRPGKPWHATAWTAALLLCTACLTVRAPRVERGVEQPQAAAAWGRVLQQHVNPRGQVDFAALAKDPRDLDVFLDYVARTDPAQDPAAFPTPQDRMAHYLNAYNALSMYGVLQAGIPRTNAGLRKIRFFFLNRYRIGGRSQSLHRYEKGIRALGEERVHFALNCMSVGCPTLPRVPFSGAALESDLDRQAREFFGNPIHLQLDPQQRAVRVSSILKFYTGDFLAHAGSLIEYINRYRAEPIPADYTVEFLPYDWTINQSSGSGTAGD
jgi:hypothetical protein